MLNVDYIEGSNVELFHRDNRTAISAHIMGYTKKHHSPALLAPPKATGASDSELDSEFDPEPDWKATLSPEQYGCDRGRANLTVVYVRSASNSAMLSYPVKTGTAHKKINKVMLNFKQRLLTEN